MHQLSRIFDHQIDTLFSNNIEDVVPKQNLKFRFFYAYDFSFFKYSDQVHPKILFTSVHLIC